MVREESQELMERMEKWGHKDCKDYQVQWANQEIRASQEKLDKKEILELRVTLDQEEILERMALTAHLANRGPWVHQEAEVHRVHQVPEDSKVSLEHLAKLVKQERTEKLDYLVNQDCLENKASKVLVVSRVREVQLEALGHLE